MRINYAINLSFSPKWGKGRSEGVKLPMGMEVRCRQKKKDYSIYETFSYIILMVTTHIQNIQNRDIKHKKGENRGKNPRR